MKNITTALRINAIFSIVSGMVLILASQRMAGLFGVSATVPFWVTGIGIGLFGAAVWYESSRKPIDLRQVLIIILSDLIWVLGSLCIIIFRLFGLTDVGYMVIGGVGLSVLWFAFHQSYALSYTDAKEENPLCKEFRFGKRVNSNSEAAWEVISDIGSYHEVAPNIDRVEILSGKGEGVVRSCTSGEDSWTETCTLWEPGNRYSFEVDTTPEDYPYPLKFLRGTWGIRNISEGVTEVFMLFEFKYEKKYQALLVHPLMSSQFRTISEDLLTNWKQKIESEDHAEIYPEEGKDK